MRTDTELARAEALVEAGDLDGARELAEAMLAADPRRPGPYNVLGFIAYQQGRLIDAQRAFEHACSLPDHGEDAASNLAAVRAELASVYGLAAGAAPAAAPEPEHDFAASLEQLHAGLFGRDLDPPLLGKLLGNGMDASLEARLDELPTATSMNERRFLLRFAARFWDGRGDVFENGPLLGGTSRALALGMLANPRRDRGAELHTHDWFTTRVPLDLPPDVWDRMIARGLMTREQKEELTTSGTFKPLYDALHAGHDYSPLLHSHVAYLPGHPGDDPGHGDALFAPPPDRTFSLVFVDGCKSWHGTRYWIERMADRMPAGSHVIFQDYGWYTCFWLPVLIGRLPDHFRLVAHVDDTYAFELVRALPVDLVRSRFPEHPAELGRDAFDDVFARLGIDAGQRSDVRSMVALTIQHAGALAYLGLKDEARAHIAGMRTRPEFAPFRQRFIDPALRSPTYTPEGPVLL